MSTTMASQPDSTSSITTTYRHDRSLLMHILQTILRPLNTRLVAPKKEYPAGSPQLTAPKSTRKKVDITERKINDIYLYELHPKRPSSTTEQDKPATKKRLYYFSGGGWQSPPSSQHWSLVTELALKLPSTLITLVSYPLAPNSPAPTTFPHLQTLYTTLLASASTAHEPVILAGDSSGGNIVLSLVVASLSANPSAPCPVAVLAISPSTDLRRTNPEMKPLEKHDPLLRVPFVLSSANHYRGTWSADDVRVSPLLADLSTLAKRDVRVHGVTGTYDILSPDAALFREECARKGVRGEWLQWERQVHCFPLMWAYGLREGREGKEWILDVLGRC